MQCAGNPEGDGALLSGMEQESLQSLLASILTSKPGIGGDDGPAAASGGGGDTKAPATPPGGAPTVPETPTTNDHTFVSTLLAQQGEPCFNSPEAGGSGSLETVLKSLQTQAPAAAAAQHRGDFTALLKNHSVPSPSTPDQRKDLPNHSSVENLVNSFLAFNQTSQQNANPSQSGLAQAAAAQQNAAPDGNSGGLSALQQLLSSRASPQQQQIGGDMLSTLLGGAMDQGSGRGNNVTDVGMVGQRQGGLDNLVSQVLRDRAAANEGGEGSAGFCALGSGTTRISSQSSPPASSQQHSGDLSHIPQHSSGSCINPLQSPYKRKLDDSEVAVPDAKVPKVQGGGDEHDGEESREQHLAKLRDQLKNLNAANVMLSRYLNGLQSSLTEILAENWSFKILIGCLTSKKQSTNPLEQMISSRIASNPSVAIPMLKNIHKSAAANSSCEQLEANSNKNAVFQNMVDLLSAQKKTAGS
mmetsp:Transcript_15650/g.43776  ORF Transcript_15650/g.43776 Transcript_15650/m.43776 type:complete len:471 (-) Transcript_15650:487-1899(-)|eukprot:CAMPEP_0117682784 /NCGR_PEP_ID=MMETSP0804-20121206/19911_1 /TAXON_ID=1074897 /ORGANISM="Tetraselmis astigmatica, Strain CCMP880" /LENGTH=470 /DNA_ID=CAMNT_0005493053 /DNA_START=238 /DNA_END=1650 /DNA_ORIENTATION=-